MDVNKLAILSNQLGGIDETAETLGTDSELVEKALAGEPLTPYETATLDRGFSELVLSNYIDVAENTQLAEDLEFTTKFLYDVDFARVFRNGVANDIIDPYTLDKGGPLFANLTRSQTEKIIDLVENSESAKEQIAEMFDAYQQDGGDIWDVDESAFWEWYRETFYPNE